MDLFIERDELGRGLARVQGIIERRSTHPLLSHVLLQTGEGGAPTLRMTATDTEVAFVGTLAANVQSPGQLAVDAANLFQIVRSLPEPTVQLVATPNRRLEIKSGRSQFKLPGHAPEEFPSLPAFEPRVVVRLREAELRRLVEQTAFAVATEDVRYGLNGAHLEEAADADGVRMIAMVATDGHRLSYARAAIEADGDDSLAIPARMLVPRKALAVLRKLVEGDDASVELAFGEGAMRFVRPDQTFWFRLIEGEFPDYHAVVPTEHKHRILVRREELAAAIRRVSILVQDRARPVRFQFRDNEVEIEIQNSDRGEVREVLPIELDGEAAEVGFNVRFLAEVLAVVHSDKVVLELANPLAPCLIRDAESSDAYFVVMPMRLG
jgi:DNA polymerase III subunit beta